MKTIILKQFLLYTLAIVLSSSYATAQIFSSLYDFGGGDGINPAAGLVFSDDMLYGTTASGGYGWGTIFKINMDGTGFTNLYDFTDSNDGALPQAALVLSGHILYGTAVTGGSSNVGTVFKLNTDGTGFTNIYNFTGGNDGAHPYAGLILSSNILYGTAFSGGSSNVGTVFAINTDGTGFTNLYEFTGGNDGAHPYAGLVLSGNILYGTAFSGGSSNVGTVFTLNTDGTGFTNIYNFTGGNDGAHPYAGLVLSGSTLYGTTYFGGSSNVGTVFAINTDGTGFTNLYIFSGGNDGANPFAGLILSGNSLYGTVMAGGTNNDGTVFALNTNGTSFTNLYNFMDGSDGAEPQAGLILANDTLYGTASDIISDGDGTVFALSLGPIPLDIQTSGQNQIVTWGNPAFSVQTASALSGPWITLSNKSPYTITATNAQAFFQLVYTNGP